MTVSRIRDDWLFPFVPMDVDRWLADIPSPRRNDMAQVARLVVAAARKYDLNPRWLLALAQKEQSFWTRPFGGDGWQRAVEWMMGYGATNSGDKPQFAGLGNQIEFAARGIRGYLTQGDRFYVGDDVGREVKVYDGDGKFTPANLAEAVCVKYTPTFAGGVLLMERCYLRWFPTPTAYPIGVIVQWVTGEVVTRLGKVDEEGEVWVPVEELAWALGAEALVHKLEGLGKVFLRRMPTVPSE